MNYLWALQCLGQVLIKGKYSYDTKANIAHCAHYSILFGFDLRWLHNCTVSNTCNSCNTGTSALPDMYAQCPRTCSA